MHQLTQQQLQNQVNQFNALYKVGDKVEVLKSSNGTDTFSDEISHKATIMGGHTAMTWLKENGSYDLTFICNKNHTAKKPELSNIPTWYTPDEMRSYLINKNYSIEIANELAERWANDLQGAFKKGYEKCYNTLIL